MQTLQLTDDDNRAKPPGFFERQFTIEPTLKQRKFDWACGVVLPTICFAADPFIFRANYGFHSALFADFKVFAYILSSVSILAMAAWLLWGDRLGELRPYIGGFFLTGGIVSLLVGLVISPYSLAGSLLLIGLLGFTPLFSGFVFLRNAALAINQSTDSYQTGHVGRAVVLGALYGFVIPFVLSF